MMNKAPLFALVLSPFMCGSAWATCSQIPLNIKDASSNTVAMSSGTSNDGNCKTYIDEDTASQFHTDLTAPVVAGTNRIGYVSDDPCTQKVKSIVPISLSTTNLQLVAGVSAQKVYICSIFVASASAFIFNVIEGTGATCVTGSELAIVGSTTAANGVSLSANSGWAQGNGGATIGVMTNASSNLCFLQNTSSPVAGSMTFVQQ